MDLNKETYEIWMVDYFDGILDSDQVSELRLFLLTHPELECSLEDDLDILDTPDAYTIDKDSLEKSIAYDDFESLAIGNIEGNLNSIEKKKYNDLIENDSVLAKHDQLFKRTILSPSRIEYPYKEALIKTKVVAFNYKRLVAISSIAASILIGVLVYNMDNSSVVKYLADQGNQPLNVLVDEAPVIEFKESSQQLAMVEPATNKVNNTIVTNKEIKETRPVLKVKEQIQVQHLTGLHLNSKKNVQVEIPALAVNPNTPTNYRISTIIQDKIEKEVPDNWKAMNVVDKLAYTVNRIGKEANTNISLKTEKDNTGHVTDWAFSLGNITISH
jgi:hypothetical protein